MSGSKPVLLIFHDGLTSPRWSAAREHSVSCRSSSGLCLDCDHEPKGPGGGRVRAAQLLAGILSLHLDPCSGFSCRPQRQIQRCDQELRPHFYVPPNVSLCWRWSLHATVREDADTVFSCRALAALQRRCYKTPSCAALPALLLVLLQKWTSTAQKSKPTALSVVSVLTANKQEMWCWSAAG